MKFRRIEFYAIMILASAFLSHPKIIYAQERAHVGTEVYYPVFPILVDRDYNVVCELTIDTERKGDVLQNVIMHIDKSSLPFISDVRLMWSGTTSVIRSRTSSIVIKEQDKLLGGGQKIWCDRNFVRQVGGVDNRILQKGGDVEINCDIPLLKGKNYCYLSCRVSSDRINDISGLVKAEIRSAKVTGKVYVPKVSGRPERRLGSSVRQSGDDGVVAYRIPGLVTTHKGTLISVYDIRYNSSLDLQNNIDIGVSRSTDKGKTWEKMRVAMDMGEWGGLPQALNGIGDPSVLIDDKTGEIFIIALWTHSAKGDRAWTGVGQGILPDETGQMMICSSKDDGLTWSQPVNITSQIKEPEWYLTLQGPGRGITMSDGTLVFPFQYIDSKRIPNAGIIYSRDGGAHWTKSVAAKSNTTEAQVVEISPGVLMLNMRDNRRTGRAVAVTYDMGKTWKEHPSSGSLVEPVCMASLLNVPAKDNVLGVDLLLFSNPAVTVGRHNMTIKASIDGGYTWLESNSLLIDEEESWGYSCLTMIDKETVGILYEGSTSQLVFQSVKLKDIVKEPTSTIKIKPLMKTTTSVSGAFAGILSRKKGEATIPVPVFGGGSDFPDKPITDGGEKKYYSKILALDGKNQIFGKLPEPLAYGGSFSIKDAIFMAGGNNGEKTSENVYSIRIQGKKIIVRKSTPLPEPIEQFGFASCGDTVYILGGLSGIDGRASRKAFKGVVRGNSIDWSSMPDLPSPSVQGIAALCNDVLYYWEGWNTYTGKTSSKGWKFIGGDWKSVAGIPSADDISSDRKDLHNTGTGVGAAAVALDENRIAVIGGVNPNVFEKGIVACGQEKVEYLSMPPAGYKFSNRLRIYDVRNDSWQYSEVSGKLALAGASVVRQGDYIIIFNGEIKPGVRTNEVCRLSVDSIN